MIMHLMISHTHTLTQLFRIILFYQKQLLVVFLVHDVSLSPEHTQFIYLTLLLIITCPNYAANCILNLINYFSKNRWYANFSATQNFSPTTKLTVIHIIVACTCTYNRHCGGLLTLSLNALYSNNRVGKV